jgi:adenylate cyclase class 2
MAYDGQEVEIKVSVGHEMLQTIARSLEKELGPGQLNEQTDVYFTSPIDDYVAPRYPYKWLSIRCRRPNPSINFKHFHPEGAELHTHCDEHEVTIDDPEKAMQLMVALGFRPVATVRKKRRTFVNAALGVEIALDEVAELGCFVEVEATKNFGDIETTRAHLESVLQQLGVDPATADPRGYPYRILERQRERESPTG